MAPLKPKSSARWAIAIVLGVSVVFGIGAIASFIRGNDAVTSIEVGDCLDNDPTSYVASNDVEKVRIVDCDDPHYIEVFYEVKHEGKELPDRAELFSTAQAACLQHVPPLAPEIDPNTNLQFFMFHPTPMSWHAGDRSTSCLLYQLDAAGTTPQQVSGTFFDSPPIPSG